ncbi:UDPGT domain-containing protein, partial [Cephalotus follicularis]
MASVILEPSRVCHVVAMPFPGRGHINPMMNLCKFLASKTDNILITFVVTEEWLGFIGAEPKPDQIRFATIPNVLPSELVRGADWTGFLKAVMTKLEAPFERLLDRLEPPANVIVSDTFLVWGVGVGNRRNVPVASFFPMSATMFSVIHGLHSMAQDGVFPVDLLEKGLERLENIPRISSKRLVKVFCLRNGGDHQQYAMDILMDAFSWIPKAQYLILASVYHLEAQVIDALKAKFSLRIYNIGPAIPYFKLGGNSSMGRSHNEEDYFDWLDRQPCNSVLYVSMGSFLSVSSAELNEIAAGLHDSDVPFLWVARGESSWLKEVCGDKGLVVPWCDQLTVLSHSSIGGFWSHCGWNSVQEGVFVGVPFLTFPFLVDQFLNTAVIVEDWKIGWRVKESLETFVTRDAIARLVQKIMDLESFEGKEMRIRVKELQTVCQHAIAKDG